MRAAFVSLVVASVVVVGAACPDAAPQPEPPQCPLGGPGCVTDADCEGPSESCIAVDESGVGCCAIVETQCPSRRGSCPPYEECVRGQCEQTRCFDTLPIPDDVEEPNDRLRCEPGACVFVDGEPGCVESPPSPASCIVTNSGVTTSSNNTVRMEALAVDERGAPAPYATNVQWSIDARDGEVLGTNSDVIRPRCDGDAVCRVNVTARVSGVECIGIIRVFPTAPADRTRVVVVDAPTRAPLAAVRVDAEVDGALVVTETNAEGAVALPGIATFVSVLPDDHEWHTIIAPPLDVLVATSPTRDPAFVAGKKGDIDFSAVHSLGDIKLALTGTSFPSLVDFELERVLGEPTQRLLDIQGITDPGGEAVNMPSSLSMQLGTNGDTRWVALGDGPIVWSIGAQVSLAQFGPLLSGALFDARTLLALASFGARFDQQVVHVDVSPLVEKPAIPDGELAAPYEAWELDELTLKPNVLAAVSRDVAAQYEAPNAEDGPRVTVAALARVAGRGFVPLGSGVESVAPGVRHLSFAPPHDGLEGSDVVIVTFRLDPATLVDSRSAVNVSASFAPLGPSSRVEMPAFVDALDASFDGAVVTSTNDVAADVYRARFEGVSGGRWTVWSSTPPSFTLDQLHAGDVDVSSRIDELRVDALVVGSGPGAFDDVTGLGGDTMLDLDRVVTSMSSRPVP